VILNKTRLGYRLSAYLMVKMSPPTAAVLQNFKDRIVDVEAIQQCTEVAGNLNFILQVISRDAESFKREVLDPLGNIEGVQSIETCLVLST